jgi:serine/threonine protein kinase
MSSIDNKILAYYYGFNLKPMKIREKCQTLFSLQKNSKKSFDIGKYGTISEACLKSKCKYIVKMIPFSSKNVYQTFLREALIAPYMAKHDVGPKIYDIFVCLNSGFIVMEKMDGSLRSLALEEESFPWKHLISISKQVSKMHKLNVVHNDLHTANILYKINDDSTYDFKVTDFGLSLYFEDKNSIVPNLFLPTPNVPNIYYPPYDFFKLSVDLEHQLGTIFIKYFFIDGYLTLFDYIFIQKYYIKMKDVYPYTFFQYIKDEQLTDDLIKKIEHKPYVLDVVKNINNYKEVEVGQKIIIESLKSNIKSSKIKTSK